MGIETETAPAATTSGPLPSTDNCNISSLPNVPTIPAEQSTTISELFPSIETPEEENQDLPLMKQLKASWATTAIPLTPVWPPIEYRAVPRPPESPEERTAEARMKRVFYEVFQNYLNPDVMTIALEYGWWKTVPPKLLTYIPKQSDPKATHQLETAIDGFIDNYRAGKPVEAVGYLNQLPLKAKTGINQLLRFQHGLKVKEFKQQAVKH